MAHLVYQGATTPHASARWVATPTTTPSETTAGRRETGVTMRSSRAAGR